MNWQRFYNPIMKTLLMSPLGALFKRTMLITFTGRKSGRQYTTPINFFRNGKDVLAISQPERTWWKNLIGSADVTLYIQGHTYKAVGVTLIDKPSCKESLLHIAHQSKMMASYLKLDFDEYARLTNPATLDAAATSVIVVNFKGLQEIKS